MKRREFLKSSGVVAAGLAASGMSSRKPAGSAGGFPYLKNPKISGKVIVLGLDGMDPILLKKFVDEGSMPTFKKLMGTGSFANLATTMPPQSPVAWSSFITGTNPGGHGIFDFIHRDPKTFIPYLSTSRSFAGKKNLKLGGYSLPLEGGRVELMRKGPVLWDILERHGIPATVFQIPANFPVNPCESRTVSGMGTPDLLGGYGTCTYITNAEVPGKEKMSSARVVNVSLASHSFTTALRGPPNPFKTSGEPTSVEISVHRDPREAVARVKVQEHEVFLSQGEWSEWIPLRFELLPYFASVGGMVRFFLQEVHPYFRLYVTPVNIDPMEPSLPICSPAGFSAEVARAAGRFYTQGLPADTKSLSAGILSDDDFLAQSKIVLEECLSSYEYLLNDFSEGLFFYYFSSLDQNQHMLWRNMDPSHPLYDPDASPEVKNAVRFFYTSMDDVLRRAMEKLDSNSTLIVMSDHGFGPFRREFHLNTWLLDNGYIQLSGGDRESGDFFQNVDWDATSAFGLGINGLYLNLRDRERFGTLDPKQAAQIKRELVEKLPQIVDPETGRRFITAAYEADKIYSGPYVDLAPDILVGYDRDYRSSDTTVLGKFTREIIGDRTDKWAADHCIDPVTVPGVMLSNKACSAASPAIWDMAPTILKAFGLETPKEMDGKPVLEA